jgi:hypothetical protein
VPMKPSRLLPMLWLFPLAITTLACPTRTILTDGGGGMDGSAGSVDSGSDRGGTSGAAGVNGPGGKGGASGAAGAVATGGAVGTGGASGGGGSGGASGGGGSGGASGLGGTGGVSGSGGTGGVSGAGGTAGASGTGASGSAGTSGVAGSGGTIRDGQPCSLAKDCTSGACSPFYVDVDGDGYGAGQATGFCGTTPPIGYSAQSGDCCDSAPNLAIAKLIHPGANFQPTSAGGTCNITWDYDCSGSVESNPQTVSCGQTYPACTTTIVNLPENLCGTGYEKTCSCGGAGDGTVGSCFTNCGGHPAITVGCK